MKNQTQNSNNAVPKAEALTQVPALTNEKPRLLQKILQPAINKFDGVEFLNLQQRLKQDRWFRGFWRFWSNYAFVFFIPAAFAIFGNDFRAELLATCALAFIAARGIATTLINFAYKRQRPYQKLNFMPITSWIFSWSTTKPNSFPSRHMTTYASVSAALLFFFPWLGILLLFVVTPLTGIARVILGFHYPTDVITGYLIGTILGLVTAVSCFILLFTIVN